MPRMAWWADNAKDLEARVALALALALSVADNTPAPPVQSSAGLQKQSLPPVQSSPGLQKQSVPIRSCIAKPLQFDTIGLHSHKCVCGEMWSHGASSRGNVAAHTCPACHRLVWQVYQHLGR